MSTKPSLFAKLFGKSDTAAPASGCCDVQIIEEDVMDERDVLQQRPHEPSRGAGN
ncbi:hypothetical protein [Streptomyces sp. NPDC056401]|uniref:hypothetical protein n=1 Tax=Streptomyces sp. NPDC056401 TaxID=3345809 RepID=UPI0035DA9537